MDVDPGASNASQVDALVSDTASEATLVDNHNLDNASDVDMANPELSKTASNGTERQLGIVMVDSEKEGQRSATTADKDSMLAADESHPSDAAEPQVPASSLNSTGSHETGTVQQTNDTMPNDSDVAMTDEPSGTTRLDDAPPPERPPPVPPRPEWKSTDQKPVDELELGAQQDVTEVIGNVLFQLECALRPKRIDENGEQLDEIKE
jgi:ubiquitin carboxyl-terminal hydrolase 25/28